MAKKKDKKEEIEGAVPDEAYVIALTSPVNTKAKGVEFRNGVGVLDYPGLALAHTDWFEIASGTLIQKAAFGFLEVLVDYFKKEHSAKITKVTGSEGLKLKEAILRGESIAKKYYKVFSEETAPAGNAKRESKEHVSADPPEKLSESDLADSSGEKVEPKKVEGKSK